MPNRGDNDNAALIASLRATAEKDSARKKQKKQTHITIVTHSTES